MEPEAMNHDHCSFLPNVLTFVYKIGKTNTNIPLAAGLNMQHYGQVTREYITIFLLSLDS